MDSAEAENEGIKACDDVVAFNRLRPKLLRLAYRMLGSFADAEDIVQDAYIRWTRANRSEVREPGAFLRSVVTHLCLDQIGSARSRREEYIGLWLPEPEVEGMFHEADDITLPLMLALERLTPLERAAFLLHDVFGLGFSEVAETIGRDATTCRKLASRGRLHVRSERVRFQMSVQDGLALAEAFFVASRDGDIDRLRAMLAADVSVQADGGGKVATSAATIGIESAISLFSRLARVFERSPSRLLRYTFVSGLPGFVTLEEGSVLQTTALAPGRSGIAAIYVTRNPDKLQHLAERAGTTPSTIISH